MSEKPRSATTKDRLVAAAYELFEERGFDATTAEDIARRAGVGRTTFFRAFGSKDDVIFPEHEQLLGRIDQRLAAATPATRAVALSEAARVVLRHYLDEESWRVRAIAWSVRCPPYAPERRVASSSTSACSRAGCGSGCPTCLTDICAPICWLPTS